MIEAMVVVTIIGVMAMAVLPGVTRMIAENRQHRVTVEVMLAARRARAEAMFGGFASALHYSVQSGDTLILPVTGLTTRCNRGDNGSYSSAGFMPPRGWMELVGAPPILMSTFSFGGQAIGSVLVMNDTVQNTGFLCWEPRGQCWYGTSPLAPLAPEAVMFFRRLNAGGNEVGTERQLVFPQSCTARIR